MKVSQLSRNETPQAGEARGHGVPERRGLGRQATLFRCVTLPPTPSRKREGEKMANSPMPAYPHFGGGAREAGTETEGLGRPQPGCRAGRLYPKPRRGSPAASPFLPPLLAGEARGHGVPGRRGLGERATLCD